MMSLVIHIKSIDNSCHIPDLEQSLFYVENLELMSIHNLLVLQKLFESVYIVK